MAGGEVEPSPPRRVVRPSLLVHPDWLRQRDKFGLRRTTTPAGPHLIRGKRNGLTVRERTIRPYFTADGAKRPARSRGRGHG